jgi:hypothetical protein
MRGRDCEFLAKARASWETCERKLRRPRDHRRLPWWPRRSAIYRSKITLIDGGKKLSVRGYIGVPMFGRSQVWLRQE